MINKLPKSLIESASSLLETFNSPLPTTELPEDSMLHQMGAFSAAMLGGENFKMHKIPDTGYIIQFDKDGATEVHHVDESLQGGYKKEVPTGNAIRFASTMANHVKGLLDQGKNVRISAHKNLADNFKSITNKLIARHPEYTTTAPVESTHEITGDPVVSWEIKKPLTEALASTAHKALATKASNKDANGLTAAQRISKDVMPTDRIVIPLERTHTPNKDVEAHLKNKGYHIDNYQQGLAYHESNPDRKLRIGRVLNSTNASQQIKTAYEKDPARQGVKSPTGASIVISRHPYDVAAMSTHQNWESCQTLGGKATVTDKEGNKNTVEQDKGGHTEYVPTIVGSGAHIAYLVNHPDDIDKHYKPIARVTLNPFVSENKNTILRPSEVYGEDWEGFHKTVSDWAEKHFPAKDAIYVRHRGAYPEGIHTVRNYGQEHDDFWKEYSDKEALMNTSSQNVIKHNVDNMLRNQHPNLVHLLSNPHIEESDSDRIVNAMAKNPRMASSVAILAKTPRQISTVMGNNLGDHVIASKLAINKNTSASQLHELMDTYGLGQTSEPGVRKMSHNGYSPNIVSSISSHANANDGHFEKVFDEAGLKSNDSNKVWESFLDLMQPMHNIARRYHSEHIGRKLVELNNKLPFSDHSILHDVAEKHPHLLSAVNDDGIAIALDRHGENKNLRKIALERNTDKTLAALASNTDDRELLGKLSNHPSESVKTKAKIRLLHLQTTDAMNK